MATFQVPFSVPYAAEDAEQLRAACEGWGTDENVLIDILAHRDSEQRQQIIQSYETIYNENLIKRLESELSGDFKKAMHYWISMPSKREAIFLFNTALKKELDYRVIIETACINSTAELLDIKKAYQCFFKHPLEEDIASRTDCDLSKLLAGLVSADRYEGEEIDNSLALSEAKVLHDAIQKKDFSHEEVIRIITTRSKAQLIATFNRYKEEHGISISKDLSIGRPHPLPSALQIAVCCLLSPHKYFQKLLRSTLKKEEIDTNTLTRIVITRAEKDLQKIRELYEERVNESLVNAISKQTSGHYKSFILALLGN